MLFLSITQFEQLNLLPASVEGVELRLDLFSHWTLSEVASYLSTSSLPVMITLRKPTHGGQFRESEKEREAQIFELLSLKPSFFDLEWDMRREFLEQVIKDHPETQVILSHHDFEKTADDLEEIAGKMTAIPAFHYKIGATAHSTNDALRLLLFAKNRPHFSAIPMGEKGQFGRILGPIIGNFLNFAALEKKGETAPGQLTVDELLTTYRWSRLNSLTELYGLIGNPVDGSQGHLYHNGNFAREKRNAVYVKMAVREEELPAFFPLAEKIGFKGLSVTMPLKEAVLPFIDEPDREVQRIQAANTLFFRGGKIFATNTDGKGALDALEQRRSVRDQRIVVVGAGGAARAIAFEAVERGAKVWIANRTVEKAKKLARDFGCEGDGVPSSYDILIQAVPQGEIAPLLPQALVMDIVYSPKETPLLQRAAALGCPVVYGEEMFFNQAALQTAFWNSKHG